MCNECNSIGRDSANFVAGAVLGAAVGAAVGLLFAPRSGRQTRLKLKSDAKRAVKHAEGKWEEFEEEKLQPAVAKAKDQMNKGVGKFKREVGQAVKKARGRVPKKKK